MNTDFGPRNGLRFMKTIRDFSIHCNNQQWLQNVLISREVHVFETNCVKGLHDFSLGCVNEPQKEFRQKKMREH